METQKASIFGIGLIAVAVLMSACASTPPPPIEGWMTNFDFLDNTTKTQEKENIKITLTPLNELELKDHPELFRFNVENWEGWKIWVNPSKRWYPPDPSGNQHANTFVGMPAFLVSVENKTGHILRMSDARLYLIVEGKDPIPAINKFGKPNWVTTELVLYEKKPEQIAITESASKGDSSLLNYITNYEYNVVQWFNKARKTDPKYKNYPFYPFNLLATVAIQNSSAYKLINQVGREILPGYSLNGILCFPFNMESGQKAKIIFFDVTTETDQAGNPIKKTQFEFEFKSDPKYVKYNELTRRWEDTTPPNVSKK